MRGMFVGELLEVLSSSELTYWIEFYNREPWGSEVENWRMGQVAATIVNCTPRQKGSKTFQPTDFYETPEKRSADTERRELIQKQVRKLAGKPKRKTKKRNG